MKKKRKIWLCAILFAVFAAYFIYAQNYYKAKPEAVEAADGAIKQNGNLVFKNESKTGFIIYPGGKVDEKAYSILAQQINAQGYTVVIAKMPLHLSILKNDAARDIMKAHGEIDEWIIIGHSLGGTSASIYAKSNPQRLRGLVLLGSYPYEDLSRLDIGVLSLTGSNDSVLNSEKAKASIGFYPQQQELATIEGGNHAYFGCYGEQKGDGAATISWQEQHETAVARIIKFFFSE